MFRKLDMFPSSGEGKETPTLLGLLEKANLNHCRIALSQGPNRVGVSLPSLEDGNRSNFRNFVFEFRKTDKVHKPSDPECYAPSSELFGFYKYKLVCDIRFNYVLLISRQVVQYDKLVVSISWKRLEEYRTHPILCGLIFEMFFCRYSKMPAYYIVPVTPLFTYIHLALNVIPQRANLHDGAPIHTKTAPLKFLYPLKPNSITYSWIFFSAIWGQNELVKCLHKYTNIIVSNRM
jgi:hypothetical protein